MNINYTNNEYAASLGRLFSKCPKTVFAALAVSFGTQGGDFLSEATDRLLEEWQILFENGIVKQKPPKKESL